MKETRFNVQASSMRALAQQLKPTAEAKGTPEANWSTWSVVEREVTEPDGSQMRQQVLCAETAQPTLLLNVQKVLSTEEVENAGVAVSLLTRDVDDCLAALGQSDTCISLTDGGEAVISTAPFAGEDKPLKEFVLRGEPEHDFVMPDLPQPDCTLAQSFCLLDLLRSTVSVAAQTANAKKRVHIITHPKCLRVQSQSLGIEALSEHHGCWQQEPLGNDEFVLSIDAVRHLIGALNAFGSPTAPLSLKRVGSCLVIKTEGVYAECEMM